MLLAALASLALIMAALVVLGMATGTRQDFGKGITPLGAVILVQATGAITLLLLGAVLRSCVVAWRGQARVGHRLLIAGLVWLFWAFLRVSEYAS